MDGANPRGGRRGSFRLGPRRKVGALVQGRVTGRKMTDADDHAIVLGVVGTTAKKHPITFFVRDQEHWPCVGEDVAAHIDGKIGWGE
jgi:hypothetical protein